ncbi:unnamed protein product [Vicia faba]|uniref:Ubiquitin-like domain-containing protein n=1 Tax=Vicia faba TaxID=3906 RepID=A0AAV1B160_VICFA|nr:unnamed protein product [Vicia faba]
MKVVVENLTGTLFYVEVENDGTVEDLKREIEAQMKLPCDRLIIILDDICWPLITKDDEKESLVNCGIQDGSHVYIFFIPVDDESTQHFVFTLPDFLVG